MLNKSLYLTAMVICIITGRLSGQESDSSEFKFPAGVGVEYGIGNIAVTDEYISKEKYSGTMPFFTFYWSRMHETYGYRLQFMFRSSDDIRNNNVSTEIVEGALRNSYLYPLKPVNVFGKRTFLFLGPVSEFYFYYNQPKIAVSGFDYAQSFAALLSLGGCIESYFLLSENFSVESDFNISLLSLGLRMVDSEEEDVSPAKLLTAFAGFNGSFRLGLRYRLFTSLSVRLAYGLQLTRISSWTPLLAVSDNLIATLSYEY